MVEAIPEGACYLKVKRDLYYRPNNQGYTGVKEEAGRYPYDAGDEQSGIAYIHEDDAPDFSPACWPEIQIGFLQKTTAALQSELDETRSKLDSLKEQYRKAGDALATQDAEIERLRTALGNIKNARSVIDGGSIAECRRMAEKALGDRHV